MKHTVLMFNRLLDSFRLVKPVTSNLSSAFGKSLTLPLLTDLQHTQQNAE